MATIYKENGEIIENVEPKNGTDFELKELQDIVDGYIEVITLQDGRLLVANEDGAINGKCQINLNATTLWLQSKGDCPIFGNVLVCSPNQIK